MAEVNLPLRQRAEQLAVTLPPLLVAAERVASTVAQGVHGRRRVGQGETFWQFRQYEPGDRPESIDWRQSAKSDRVFVRQTEWEAAQSIWIWRDLSHSMDWRSSDDHPTKRERADLLTLALAALLVRGGEHVGLLGIDRRASAGRTVLTRLALSIDRGDGPLEDLPPVLPLPRNAHVVLIGDLLTSLEEIDRIVRGYAEAGMRGYILQVLDPAEETLPYGGRIRFQGVEDDMSWLLARVESVREDYVGRLTAHRTGVQAIAQSAGWGWSCHRTDQPPHIALLSLYTALSVAPRR